ncbi:hypothetical protein [Streptomyces resistomycificus]|uniref:hypothetical protein n=1 Tax=Streptomyces resistomycificus TaxID=67356 RepID=UPI000A909872|nr:hypothetical protein [Streptomyces resistomycificus]
MRASLPEAGRPDRRGGRRPACDHPATAGSDILGKHIASITLKPELPPTARDDHPRWLDAPAVSYTH